MSRTKRKPDRGRSWPDGSWMLSILLVLMFMASSCTDTDSTGQASSTASTEPGSAPSTSMGTSPEQGGFDSHTLPALASVDAYFDLAREGVHQRSSAKFLIPDLLESDEVVWLDSNFYELHDEWYWFLLLNGQEVPGSDTRPVNGENFSSVEEVYDWANSVQPGELPLDLRWVNSRYSDRRLYSKEFYQLALHAEQRGFGAGSLLHFPALRSDGSVGEEHWLIEFEYTDALTAEEVGLFFERLAPTLPSDIADNLQWVVRSPHQEQLAQKMTEDKLPYHDQVVRFDELVPAGEVSIYNEGVTAGRLLLVGEDGSELTASVETDILLVDNAPDWLPPASALISSGPQTPLAHVNLLARNRGIPNASQAGILNDAWILQAARVRAPAIVRASAKGGLEIVLISEDEYKEWRSLRSKDQIAVPAVEVDALSLVLDLTDLSRTIANDDDVAELRPIIGGKAAGFLTLIRANGVSTPETPLAITVRPYMEHLELVQDELDAMLGLADFQDSARARYLLLEGPEDYAEFYTSESDAAYAEQLIGEYSEDSFIGNILAAGGFKDFFRDAPMNASNLAEITAVLEATYGDYADGQGLRFRSSSSVEDIEGFSGAGLYDSNTGFLHPELQDKEKDQKKSVERTIKKTWSSYWGFEAFEERRLENVDHLSGAMAVLVHARFDDPLEMSNGVATFTLLPDRSGLAGDGATSLVRINTQLGDVSVTNPDPGSAELPEVVEVRIASDGSLDIVRVSSTTLLEEGTGLVMDDDAITELVTQLEAVTRLWRDQVNASLPGSHQIQTVTLDFEFKTMAEGWPALAGAASPFPGRLIVKQARSLDPGRRGIPESVLALPVPRDVLARASLVQLVECGTSVVGGSAVGGSGGDSGDGSFEASATWHEIFTDPLRLPDIGYSEIPLVVGLGSDDLDAQSKPEPGLDCERTTLLSTPDRFLLELLWSYS